MTNGRIPILKINKIKRNTLRERTIYHGRIGKTNYIENCFSENVSVRVPIFKGVSVCMEYSKIEGV